MDISKINFDKASGLIPVVIQDTLTNCVLMVGFMNTDALMMTLEQKRVTFYSRTKKRLWTKGETSGHFLAVEEIKMDCDEDTLLIKATPNGNVCHTGSDTCFDEKNGRWNLRVLENTIRERKRNSVKGSYTSSLFEAGINKIAQKVGEEAVELVIESKDENGSLFLNEAADLMFHYLVLLIEKGYGFDDVLAILKDRGKK
ncbi:MAG TPA: bifunctional phosphoribosyl-AMP cyclohydrolase/phosphoribosyl-ATP diphosphatase HisIE [Chryseosolibacter sp.]|nr:bifunctional phosphoribosyl-AMP cyclohydrolase/phosphoribosyl-ATP diphosphatase HisIE [Chryseosolibacter sp.]